MDGTGSPAFSPLFSPSAFGAALFAGFSFGALSIFFAAFGSGFAGGAFFGAGVAFAFFATAGFAAAFFGAAFFAAAFTGAAFFGAGFAEPAMVFFDDALPPPARFAAMHSSPFCCGARGDVLEAKPRSVLLSDRDAERAAEEGPQLANRLEPTPRIDRQRCRHPFVHRGGKVRTQRVEARPRRGRRRDELRVEG